MSEELKHDIRAVSSAFRIDGDFLCAQPCGSGHINDSYLATFDEGDTRVRYVVQRINHQIFKDPMAVMKNITRVTEHLRGKLAGMADSSRRALTVIPTCDGRPLYRDESGNYWRVFLAIENARSYDSVQSPRQAYEAAKGFGAFQKMLADLRRSTIARYHSRFSPYPQTLRCVGAGSRR